MLKGLTQIILLTGIRILMQFSGTRTDFFHYIMVFYNKVLYTLLRLMEYFLPTLSA